MGAQKHNAARTRMREAISCTPQWFVCPCDLAESLSWPNRIGGTGRKLRLGILSKRS